MANPQLRVYLGPADSCEPEIASPRETVRSDMTVTLGDILPLLADAVQMRRAWLKDFQNDPVTLRRRLVRSADGLPGSAPNGVSV